MNIKKFYNIHNLVSVTVDAKVRAPVLSQIDFQINYFLQNNPSDLKRSIEVFAFDDFVSPKYASIYYDNFYQAGNLLYNSQKRTAIQKFDDKFIIYTDTPILINLFIQFLIYKDGYTFVHAAGVVDTDNKAILFPASGGVGKTAILGALVKDKGFKLLGDDLVLLHKDGTCLAFPRPFILKSYHRETYPEVFDKLSFNKQNNSIFRKFFKFSIKNAPFYHAISTYLKDRGLYSSIVSTLPLPQDYVAAVPVKEIFGADSISNQPVPLKRINYMERTTDNDFSTENILADSIAVRMFSVLQDEWHEYVRLVLSLGSTEIVSLPNYYDLSFNSMKEAIRLVDKDLIKIPNSSTPNDLYNFYIRNYE